MFLQKIHLKMGLGLNPDLVMVPNTPHLKEAYSAEAPGILVPPPEAAGGGGRAAWGRRLTGSQDPCVGGDVSLLRHTAVVFTCRGASREEGGEKGPF